MKPSDAALKTIAERYARAYGSEESRTVVWLAKAELQRRQQPASVPAELTKYQPCGCVVCTCADEIQCQGCGAKNCGTHPVGQFPVAAYGREQAHQIEVNHD